MAAVLGRKGDVDAAEGDVVGVDGEGLIESADGVRGVEGGGGDAEDNFEAIDFIDGGVADGMEDSFAEGEVSLVFGIFWLGLEDCRVVAGQAAGLVEGAAGGVQDGDDGQCLALVAVDEEIGVSQPEEHVVWGEIRASVARIRPLAQMKGASSICVAMRSERRLVNRSTRRSPPCLQPRPR